MLYAAGAKALGVGAHLKAHLVMSVTSRVLAVSMKFSMITAATSVPMVKKLYPAICHTRELMGVEKGKWHMYASGMAAKPKHSSSRVMPERPSFFCIHRKYEITQDHVLPNSMSALVGWAGES